MKAYFDRTAPLFLTRERNFDGYPVEVPEEILLFTEYMNRLIGKINKEILIVGAPEDSAEYLSDIFVDGVINGVHKQLIRGDYHE